MEKLIVSQVLIHDLLIAYESLSESLLAVKAAIENESSDFSIYLPGHAKSAPDLRLIASQAMTVSTFDQASEDQPLSGLCCASSQTVAAVERLNQAKHDFKSTVLAIKKAANQRSITGIVEAHCRAQNVSHALAVVGIKNLNLSKCYASIRIFPSELKSVSWTWAMKHSRIQKLTLTQAFELLDKMSEGAGKDFAASALNRCNANESLACKVQQPPQLRANYVYVDSGKDIRKSCTVSGIMIAQQKYLPRYRWVEQPKIDTNAPPRFLERESTIAAEPLVPALNLYRYNEV